MFSSIRRPKPAPPPVGRTVSWPTHHRTVPGAPVWIQRRTMRVDMLVTNVEGNVERVTQLVNVDE